MTAQELIKFIQDNYQPEDVLAWDVWTREDVESSLRFNHGNDEADYILVEPVSGAQLSLSKDDMDQILMDFHKNRDAEYGLNWGILDATINSYVEENGWAFIN